MQDKYIRPELEIYEFDVEDVIYTSGGEGGGGGDGDKEGDF